MTKIVTAIAVWLILCSPVAAQETTTAADVRAIIEDLRDGTLDSFEAESKLSKAIRKQKSKARKRFKRFGEIEAIEYWDSFMGIDIYLVAYKHARVVWTIARDDDGTIERLRYRTLVH